MSYGFREPEEPPLCECKYDAIRDQMDREDCRFHCELVDDQAEMEIRSVKASPSMVGARKDAA